MKLNSRIHSNGVEERDGCPGDNANKGMINDEVHRFWFCI